MCILKSEGRSTVYTRFLLCRSPAQYMQVHHKWKWMTSYIDQSKQVWRPHSLARTVIGHSSILETNIWICQTIFTSWKLTKCNPTFSSPAFQTHAHGDDEMMTLANCIDKYNKVLLQYNKVIIEAETCISDKNHTRDSDELWSANKDGQTLAESWLLAS